MAKNKLLSLLLAVAMLLPLAGCTGNSPITEATFQSQDKYVPPIELTIPAQVRSENGGRFDYLNNPWIDAYTEELGIIIKPKWEGNSINGPSLSEQLAAGVVPDLMPGLGRLEFEFVVHLGLAADLTGLISKYASPLTLEILYSDNGYSIQSSTIDNKIYAMPYVYGNTDNIPLMWIRTDWLNHLGLTVPQTGDELRAVLEAFVYNDPDDNGLHDTFGLLSTGSLWELGAVFNMFGAQPFWSWYYGTDHRLRYSTVSFIPEIKNALHYMQDLYMQGLLYPEFGVLPVDRYYQMIAEGKVGVAFEYKYLPLHIQDNTPGGEVIAEWQAYPIPTALSDRTPARPFSYHGPAAYNVVSTKCEHPEAAVMMLNMFTEKVYSDFKDNYYDTFVKTPEGISVKELAVFGTSLANDLSEYENIAAALQKGDPFGLNRSEMEKYRHCISYLEGDLAYWAEYQCYRPDNATVTAIKYYMTEVKPFFSDYYGPEPTSASLYFSLLNNRWLDTCTQIIMGIKKVDDYDNYVHEWYELGGIQVENEINAMVSGEKP